MKRTTYLTVACLLSGLMAATIISGLRGPAQAASVVAPSANALDVAINEVAWAGHSGYTGDEWIELHNNTAQTISLNGWRLYSSDGGPSITLSSDISPHGYYLIERTDDNTISDIPADLTDIPFGNGLSNSGEVLTLSDNLNNVIDTANASGGEWPAGAASTGAITYTTMERIDSTATDTDANWCTNDGITRNGLDASGNPINGTPKAQNSGYQTPAADLRITKTGPATVSAGDPITYYLALGNSGDVTATATRITDTLPAGVEFITQTSPFTFSQPVSALVWEVGSVPTGALHAITITGRVTDTATGDLTNHVTATTTATETVTTNNTDSWVTTVTVPGQADLFVTKTGPGLAAPDSSITYYITIGNAGSIAADTTRLTDTLPAAVEFVTQDSPFAFTPTGRILIWFLGDVPIGDQHTITITGRVAGSALFTLTNHVTATTTASETITTNNTDSWETNIGYPGTAVIQITALHHHGYDVSYDEGVQIANLGTAPTDLDDWYLSDVPTATTGAAFPAGATLPAGVSIWCAKSAQAFADEFGFKPDYETEDTDPTVPELTGSWPGFRNDGDECAIFDADKRLIDVLVYGDSTSQIGWSGAAVQPWAPSTAFAKEGQILYRKLDQTTGRPVTDTNTADNWAQDPNDHINGRKAQYPGWDLTEFFQTTQVTETANLVVAVAPDNAYEIIKSYIESATDSILIEGYTFENAHLIDTVVSRAQAGVTVRVLLEGGKVTDQERWFCQRLDDAGGKAYFFHNDAVADIHDRYRNQHAKFIILDGQTLIVGSENFNYSGLPADDKSNGTWGRRGTFLITDAPSIVARAQAIFDRDLDDTTHKDIVAWDAPHPRYGDPTPGFSPTYVYSDWATHTVHFNQPLILTDTVFTFEVVQSPENSLRDTDSLLGLVKRARAGDTVLVEQLYEREHWGATDSTPTTDPNPRLEAYIAAARRGAKVRILLNGSWDTGSVSENAVTCAYVNTIARSEGLNLQAGLGDPLGRGIHNKMVLVWLNDGGGYAHVGSINGSEASSKINRELALQVRSDEVYHYLERVFEVDWWLAHPVFLPLVMRNYAPPAPPVEYVVISEVMYRPSGQSSGKREWVELYNPTDQPIDLSNWQLGDAVSNEYGAGRYAFPSGTVLQAGGVIVISQQAEDFEGVTGFDTPHYEFLIDPYRDAPTVPDMIPVGIWEGFGFGLGDAGDKVILRTPAGVDVDVIVYGTATYPGIVPHAGGVDYAISLERRPPYYDTDDCSLDFRPRDPPTPGSVPLP